ncbi:hypothetical protein [Roseovarius sp. D22-M7]|uniref:hypothetical protein n=1 Tax=Roseovarius sp. D22-M7 TaxID=3127116 RepID=UPI00300F9930
MKITEYIYGGKTRCVQAAFRMFVHAKTGKDIGCEKADKITGYVEGRGTWQFRMLLGLASFGLQVVDQENFDIELFLSDPEEAIRRQVGDPDTVAAIIQETDLEAEKTAVRKCLELQSVQFLEKVPARQDILKYLEENWLLMVNVNRRILDGKPGREGHILIVEALSGENIFCHDPGPGGGLNIPIKFDLFEVAWKSPEPDMANIIAVRG